MSIDCCDSSLENNVPNSELTIIFIINKLSNIFRTNEAVRDACNVLTNSLRASLNVDASHEVAAETVRDTPHSTATTIQYSLNRLKATQTREKSVKLFRNESFILYFVNKFNYYLLLMQLILSFISINH